MSGHYDAPSVRGGALEALRRAGWSPSPVCFQLQRAVTGWGGSEDCIEDEECPQQVLTDLAQAELRFVQRNLVAAVLEEPSRCKPIGLSEPQKVRIVTTGPVTRYAALGVVQRNLWKQLKRWSHFAIGAPVTGKSLFAFFGGLPEGKKWLSGDYKAATDNIATELSEHCANQIADATEMPLEYRQLFVDALVNHEYDMGDDSFRPQRRGQLMGSPVSFPVLCLINMALIWAAIAPGEERLENVRAMVNGDDCVFPATAGERAAWADLAGLVGLEPSVGKTYFSSDYLVMNSTMFSNKFDEEQGFPEIPFLNLGLLIGMK